ncbi:MAG: metal-dependent hydrolase [Planctomycetota bacterium]|jgi:membrane-bound metal-dependent hydrolase YbcI (DUF457 family)|nr:metal-dependent hydrolase [Planctomycetota bacterium]
MDTVTHALVGAAVSDCYFRRRLGPLATPLALIVSALPDFDMAARLVSRESVWMYHRGFTHSFLPMLAAAPILGYLGYRLSRRESSWTLWSLLALICLFGHTLLDLATSWGTMPLLPFSNARLSWDIVPIVDIFLTSTTAASFVINRILRWERVDNFLNPLAYPVVHRHPARQRAGDWLSKVAMTLVVLYLAVGWHQNRQTVRIAREELARQGVEAVEVRALPIMFTYVAYGIAARDAGGTIYNAAYSSYARGPMRFVRFESLPRDELAGILATPQGGLFEWYTQNMYVADREAAEWGERIWLHDRRFFLLGNPEQGRFDMEFRLDFSGAVTGVYSEQLGRRGIVVKEELLRLWELTRDGRDMDATNLQPGSILEVD